MRTNQEYKNAALAALKGHWANVLAATVIMIGTVWLFMIPYMLAYYSALGLISVDSALILPMMLFVVLGMLLLVPPMDLGYSNALLQFVSGRDDNVIRGLADNAFRGYWRNVWGLLLMRIFVSLWALLLFVPGIIKSYSYALTPYLLKEYPELSANQCINLSKKMMKGHKLDLFLLQISFIGWGILCIFSVGIGLLWLAPYISASLAVFYQDVKAGYVVR